MRSHVDKKVSKEDKDLARLQALKAQENPTLFLERFEKKMGK